LLKNTVKLEKPHLSTGKKMANGIENKTIFLSNISLLEDVIRSKDENQEKMKGVEKDGEKTLLFMNFKEKDIGYVSIIVESNGMLTYMYLPFYEVDSNGSIGYESVLNICNEINKTLSPARLVLNDNKIYGLCSFKLNLMQMKKENIRSLLDSFKLAIEISVGKFKSAEKEMAPKKKSKDNKNNILGRD